jgi:hypothetical protein
MLSIALTHSFKSRLRNIAHEKHRDPTQLWQDFVLEQFHIQHSHSEHEPHFILKGGSLLAHYMDLNGHTQD